MCGVVLLSSSLPLMILGVVPMLTGLFSYLLFQTDFSWNKIGAVFVSVMGIFLNSFVALKKEAD